MRLWVLSCAMVVTLWGCFPSTSPTASIPLTPAVQQIETVVHDMQQAVLAGERKAYLSQVDLSDPVFAIEHQRWADGWSEQPPTSFRLSIGNLKIENDVAEGELTMDWTTKDHPERLTARFPVQFHRGEDGMWRYAGEAWTISEVEHFRIHTWPDTKEIGTKLIHDLPEIYTHVTSSLDYQPDQVMEIKLLTQRPS